MYRYIEWFELNYPHLRDKLKSSMHNFDNNELNPYHIESDCWSHTMMVCKVAELFSYDKTVQISALLHDIGKPFVRGVNPKNKHVHFYNHEAVSAFLSIEILQNMKKEFDLSDEDIKEIITLIALHSLFYRIQDTQKIFSIFKNYKRLYLHLIDLVKCDKIGRFSENIDFKTEDSLREISFKMRDEKLPKEILELFSPDTDIYDIKNQINKLTGVAV